VPPPVLEPCRLVDLGSTGPAPRAAEAGALAGVGTP
jgi:hypothetical protein